MDAWIGEHAEDLTPPFRWTRLSGGHSNLTYQIQDANGTRAVVRRPPLGKLLPTAHDMGREYRVISALTPTPVPVARPMAFCEDTSVTGAPFYVMSFVEGEVLRGREDALRHVPEPRRRRVAESLLEVLADLHSLDPVEIGLGDLGRPDHYVARQLHRWFASWNASHEAAQLDLPAVGGLHGLLSSCIPDQGPGKLVHGDYGLHNCLVGSDHRIAAVLDWEISTLGDPLADLAYAMNAWAEPGDEPSGGDAPSLARGFPSRAELLERYARRSGRDLSDFPFYIAFNHWKSACIIQGVYARYLKGQKSTHGVDVEGMAERVRRHVARAEQAAKSV